jgi:hypothetical protein
MPRKSKSTYPPNWPAIAQDCKDRAGWKCIRCKHEHDPALGYGLTVHHLDLDPSNNAWWNLAALCQRCHLRIQAKVIMERYYMFEHTDWFKPYVAGYYAHLHNQPEDKEYVLAHLDELLAYGRP